MGDTFRMVTRARFEGRKRRKLLALIAAYADAGEQCPPMRELHRRLGWDIRKIDRLLEALERDGLLRVERRAGPHRRNRYTVPPL